MVLCGTEASAQEWDGFSWEGITSLGQGMRLDARRAAKAVAPYILNKHGHLFAVDTIVLLDAHMINPVDVTVLDIVLRKHADRVRGKKGKSFAGKNIVVVGDDIKHRWKDYRKQARNKYINSIMKGFVPMPAEVVHRMMVVEEGHGEN